MPSLATWGALGGAGKAVGQSLQDLIAQRFAEQKQRELLAHQEAQLEQERLRDEALSEHHRTMEARAQESATSLAGTRSATEASTRAGLERATAAEARRVAAMARLNDMTPEQWESTPQHQRYGLISEAYGGGSPPSGVIETAKERQEREAATRKQAFDERADLIRLTASLRPDPQDRPVPIPPAASALNTAIFNKYRHKGIQAVEDSFKHHVNMGSYDNMGDEIDLQKVHDALLMTFRRWKLAGGKEQGPLDRFLGNGETPAPQAPQAPTINVNGLKVRPLP